jgi:hypothetical protein
MAVRPPGKDELAAIARRSFGPMVAGLLSSYDAA